MELGILLIGLLFFAIFIGVPVAFAIGIASLAVIIVGDLPTTILAQRIFAGIDSFPILAIPFFMLAGNLMSAGGINDRILRFSNAVVGWMRGSLAIVTVFASSVFAAISGSGVATVSAIGGVTIPAMKRGKYSPEFAAAVASASAILGPLIPPSIFLIVYGTSVQMSIRSLFAGAFIPGLMLSVAFAVYAYSYAVRNKLPAESRISTRQIVKETKDNLLALLMPVIILGGIFGGIFTPTEAAAVSAVYAFIVGAFVYKGIRLDNIKDVLLGSSISTAIILMLLATSNISGWIIVVSHLPQAVTESFLSITESGVLLILLINILLLVVGMFMEGNSAIVILTPILLPIAESVGMSPLTFGVMMTVNLCIGLITPPVGACLLLGNDIAEAKFERSFVASIPFIAIGIAILLLIVYVPFFTEWLPSVL